MSILKFLKIKRNPVEQQTINEEIVKSLDQINRAQNNITNHLITLTRLGFIKPNTLIREMNNVQANDDYLKQLISERAKNENKNTSKKN